MGGGNPLAPIRQYYAIKEARTKADYVLVIVHGGHEHFQHPSPRMKETYRFFIDAGADAVVNHHQHCYCGYEIYQNKPIFYGLGNFCFDDPGCRNHKWNEGFGVTIDFNSTNISFEIHPYIQCNDEATVQLLSEQEQSKFKYNVKRLNEIILDDKRLLAEHRSWMDRTSIGYLLALEPYQNHYFCAAYYRKLLPSFLTKRKRLNLQNYLVCESHYERLVNAIIRYEDIKQGKNHSKTSKKQ